MGSQKKMLIDEHRNEPLPLIDNELKEIDNTILRELRLIRSYRKENELSGKTKKLICDLADSIREV